MNDEAPKKKVPPEYRKIGNDAFGDQQLCQSIGHSEATDDQSFASNFSFFCHGCSSRYLCWHEAITCTAHFCQLG
jgi:hypothetical protein